MPWSEGRALLADMMGDMERSSSRWNSHAQNISILQVNASYPDSIHSGKVTQSNPNNPSLPPPPPTTQAKTSLPRHKEGPCHSHKALATAQPCHLLKPNRKPSSSHSISTQTNINTQFLLQTLCAHVCVCVCVCVCVSAGACVCMRRCPCVSPYTLYKLF